MSQASEQIKEKLDLVEFLKEHMELKPAGRNFKALCPFHSEKTPSFMISPERQSWRCFGGCNEGGDIFAFLMKYENIEFYEALKILAEKAGVELKKEPGAADQRQFDILYELNRLAKEYFHHQLLSATDSRARLACDYLAGRGLKKETIIDFEIGLAPAGVDQLTRHLLNQSFNIKDIERSGLAFKTDRGTYWDRFRNRLMFPIANGFGKCVAFTGRILPDDILAAIGAKTETPAKYLNSPETPIFNKSKVLYGLDKAKAHIRRQDWVLLVEGQMDVVMAYQDGVKTAVASSGTALTADQLKALRRLASRLVISFDSDAAGQQAADRAIDLALAQDFTVRLLKSVEKDPADIVKSQPGHLINLVKDAQSAMDFYFQRYLAPEALARESSRKQNTRILLSKIKNNLGGLDRSYWLKSLSLRLGLPEAALTDELNHLPNFTSNQSSRPASEVTQPKLHDQWPRRVLLAARVLDLGGSLPDDLNPFTKTPPPENLLLQASFTNRDITEKEKDQERVALLKFLKTEFFKEHQNQLKLTIATAEANNNQEALNSALREFDIVSKELHNK